jgi:hypothetical protein
VLAKRMAAASSQGHAITCLACCERRLCGCGCGRLGWTHDLACQTTGPRTIFANAVVVIIIVAVGTVDVIIDVARFIVTRVPDAFAGFTVRVCAVSIAVPVGAR